MQITTLNKAVESLDSLIREALEFDEVISIATDNGNVVLISEEAYRGFLLTLEVEANPKFKESLLEARNSPRSEFVERKKGDV